MMKSVHEIITDRFIKQLKKGVVPWRRPWKMLGESPINLKTKRPYRGINILLLLMEGYSENFWASYKQWGSMGSNIKAGEKGTPVIFWKWLKLKEEEREIPFLRYYSVFNIEQVENLDPHYVPKKEELPEFEPIDKARGIIENMPNKPEIKHGGDRAYYAPLYDRIQLPIPEAFISCEEYYSTAFHELVHATGHQSRLNRKEVVETNFFGSHDYSKEELVAELGSAFLCAECEIVDRIFDNSAAYVNGWMEKLEKNSKWIIHASSKAEKAYRYIITDNDEHGV